MIFTPALLPLSLPGAQAESDGGTAAVYSEGVLEKN